MLLSTVHNNSWQDSKVKR